MISKARAWAASSDERARARRGLRELLSLLAVGGWLLILLVYVLSQPPTALAFAVDRQPPQVVLRNFYGVEHGAAEAYRWSKPEAVISVPVAAPADYRVTLTLGGNPSNAPARMLTIYINGVALTTVPLDGPPREVAVVSHLGVRDWAGRYGQILQVELQSSAFVPTGDPRALGVIVSHVAIAPIMAHAPPFLPLLGTAWLLVALVYGALRVAGVPWHAATVSLALVMLGASLFSVANRPAALLLACQPLVQPGNYLVVLVAVGALAAGVRAADQASAHRNRLLRVVALAAAVMSLVLIARGTYPSPSPGQVPGPTPDSPDYAYGAAALLHGRYTVEWDGESRTPRYSPGFSLALVPAVALGGVAATVWVPYGAFLFLAALLVALCIRADRLGAAPLALALTLSGGAASYLSGVVLSDLPSVALLLSGLWLLSHRGRRAAVLAGLVASGLVWLRPANAVLLLAGLSGLTALPAWRSRSVSYLLAALPMIGVLVLWQWVTFGSPLSTGYQATGASADGSSSLGALFSPHYLRSSWPGQVVDAPNGLYYTRILFVGGTGDFAPYGVGFLGLIGLGYLATERGPRGAIGRFGLATTALLLVVYLPYFYQAARFVLPVAVLLNLGAVMLTTTLLGALCRRARAVYRLGANGSTSGVTGA